MPSTTETLIVLAAGRGSRLGPVCVPKWLLPLRGRRLAEWQLAALPHGVLEGFAERVVVTGFAIETVEAFVKELASPFRVLFNDKWRDFNNWYSLLLALDYLSSAHFRGNVVLLNSDLLFSTSTVDPFFSDQSQRKGDIDILVDFQRELTEEAMKISCEENDNARVTGIGKVGVRCPMGEDIGMWRMTAAGWGRLRSALREFVSRPECAQLWYQAALSAVMEEDRSAGRPTVVSATETGSSVWIEIDDRRDVEQAEKLLLGHVLVDSWDSREAATAYG
jgi:choline kinase